MTANEAASIATRVRALAGATPDAIAYATPDAQLTWAGYDAATDRLAAALCGLGLAPGERVGVVLPDGIDVHVAFVACEKAGLVAMGIGPRAGEQEVEHLLRKSGALAWITLDTHQGRDTRAWSAAMAEAGLPLRHHVRLCGAPLAADEFEVDGAAAAKRDAPPASSWLRADALFLLNSTSGTTGMPKIVRHDQLRWMAFHRFAVDAGALCEDDVFMSVVPAPFGFGIWTSHVTPTLLGTKTVLLRAFDAEQALDAIERERVTVLAAVTTQFILMLEAASFEGRDLSSLRALFTGGEPVPFARAAAFEERTGAAVLQFYGSNETGAVSRTTLADPRDKRLATAGRVLPEMNVRLFDDAGRDVTSTGSGQPGCKGPTLSGGYWDDAAADAELIREDGWMMLGDRVTIDADGWLEVVGRVDDFIIRGGKNISGPAVEAHVASHPAVVLAAAVGMPDPTFGERVCAYVELSTGATLDLDTLTRHLAAHGVSKESWPEHLVVMDALPRGSGGKVAKQQLRDDAARRASETAGAR